MCYSHTVFHICLSHIRLLHPFLILLITSDEDADQSPRVLHHGGHQSTVRGSDKQIAYETNELEGQSSQSGGTLQDNHQQCISGVEASA